MNKWFSTIFKINNFQKETFGLLRLQSVLIWLKLLALIIIIEELNLVRQ